MSLEKVDLLSVLRKARTTGTVEAPVPAPEPVPSARPTMETTLATITSPEPERTAYPAARVRQPEKVLHEELDELADLRAELYGDEMLMQRILGLLYRRKKSNPNSGFISILDLERTLNIEREGAAFIMAYMKTQKVMEMDDKSRMAITVPGINYLRSVLGLHAATSSAAALEHPGAANER